MHRSGSDWLIYIYHALPAVLSRRRNRQAAESDLFFRSFDADAGKRAKKRKGAYRRAFPQTERRSRRRRCSEYRKKARRMLASRIAEPART